MISISLPYPPSAVISRIDGTQASFLLAAGLGGPTAKRSHIREMAHENSMADGSGGLHFADTGWL